MRVVQKVLPTIEIYTTNDGIFNIPINSDIEYEVN